MNANRPRSLLSAGALALTLTPGFARAETRHDGPLAEGETHEIAIADYFRAAFNRVSILAERAQILAASEWIGRGRAEGDEKMRAG